MSEFHSQNLFLLTSSEVWRFSRIMVYQRGSSEAWPTNLPELAVWWQPLTLHMKAGKRDGLRDDGEADCLTRCIAVKGRIAPGG